MTVLVGKKAPDFTTKAVAANGEITDYTLSSAIAGKYGVVFFYPLDFTFVCPTELVAMDHIMEELKALNVEVVGVSIDSHWTHNAWRETPISNGGIGAVGYTLAADMDHSICRAYGIESDGGLSKYPAGVAMRATFIIDTEGVVRHMTVNDEPIGRNMDEVLRVVKAWQSFKQDGHVCPANWAEGKAKFKPGSPEAIAQFMTEHSDKL